VEYDIGNGTFGMNSHAEIQEAFQEYQLGKMGEIAPPSEP
jgi:redox-sensitive bicupin YhaK (pirin superfamily)